MDGSQCLNCVRSEIHNVLSTMRRNGRWASEERFMREIPSDFETPLIRSLKSLHDYLQPFEDINDVDAVAYLQPFLDVVAFPNTNGAMTGRALSSINKFLLYGSVTQESPRGREAINLAVASVVECKFEATNSYNDEVVLMQLLEVMVNLLRCPAGPFISDVNVWKMVETCYRLATEKGTSQLLRRTAANSLTHLILTLFSRASEIITVDAIAALETRSIDFDGPPDGYQDSVVSWHRARRQSGEEADSDGVAGDGDSDEEEDHVVDSRYDDVKVGESSPYSVGTNGEDIPEAFEKRTHPDSSVTDAQIGAKQRNQSSAALSLASQEEDPDEVLYRMLQPIKFGNASAAVTALQRRAPHSTTESYGLPLLVKVLEFLSELTDPSRHSEPERVFALQLINIVLESGGESLATSAPPRDASMQETSPIITVLQGDLCKHLLQNSQSLDLSVLSLTLRVIFNLFNAMKGHLKVQLEVFLTSVHLRIAESPSATFEQKELALESLLDFCREPALMLDLYTNYDCDFRCTNLFETLCKCLCRCSIPKAVLSSDVGFVHASSAFDYSDEEDNVHSNLSSEEFSSRLDSILGLSHEELENGGGVTVLEALALEGVLAVIDSIAKRCDKAAPSRRNGSSTGDAKMTVSKRINEIKRLADKDSGMESDSSSSVNQLDMGADEELAWLASARERSANALRERKRMKRRLLLAARQFNKQPNKQYWLEYAHDLGILPHSATPSDIAAFFLNTPGLDKAAVGDYLSEDPERKPFNNQVMKAYIQSFDFEGVRIDLALRMLLESFRLPGEAQKVDRLMEAFGAHLYEQNKLPQDAPHQSRQERNGEQQQEGGDSVEQETARGIFKSADAAFIFAFSIIMLHTDLHNPGIAPEKKMKLNEFIKNNRNINEGENLPESLLIQVYHAIKNEEMRMLYDPHSHSTGLYIDEGSNDSGPKTLSSSGPTWDTVLRHSQMVDKASFTPKSFGRLGFFRAGVHERDMYAIVFDYSMQSISVMFEMTKDGKTAARALEGFKNLGKIAVYFEMVDQFNRVMITLCKYFVRFFPMLGDGCQSESDLEGLAALRDATILSMRPHQRRLKLASSLAKAERFAAYPSCRALLTFRALLSLTKQYGNHMRESWRNFIQTLLSLHELDLLPSSFVEVDDVVDAHGNRLPTSAAEMSPSHAAFAVSTKSSQGRPVSSQKKQSGGGFFSTLTSFIWSEEEELDETYLACKDIIRETLSACRLITVFSKSKSLSDESLILLLDALLVPLEEPAFMFEEETDRNEMSQLFERNTVLCVELLTEVGLANADRVGKIWPLLRRSYRQVLVNAGALPEGDDESADSFASFAGSEKKEKVEGEEQEDDDKKGEDVGVVGNNVKEGQSSTPRKRKIKRILKKRPNRVRKVGRCSVFVVERVVVSLLRIGVHMVDKLEVLPSLLGTLNWLADFSDEICSRLASRIGSGLSMVLRFQAGNLTSAVEWRIVCRLLERFSHFSDSVDATWELVQTVVQNGHVNRVNMNNVLETINLFIRDDEKGALPPRGPIGPPPKGSGVAVATSSPSSHPVGRDLTARWAAERAAEGVRLIFEISKQVFSTDPDFCSESLEKRDAVIPATHEIVHTGDGSVVVNQFSELLLPDRQKCWILMIVQLRNWFADPRPEVAACATQCLQNALWSPPERIEAFKWTEIFDQVLFPLVEHCATVSNSHAVIRSTNLLTRTFLHNVGALGSTPELHLLWLKMINFMSKRLRGDENVRESTLENLKNLIMVMQAEGLFEKVSQNAGQNIWELTWNSIESQAPGVRAEIETALKTMLAPPIQQQQQTQHSQQVQQQSTATESGSNHHEVEGEELEAPFDSVQDETESELQVV